MTNIRGAEVEGLPDFIIIGAAKAGTTSLARYLASLPEVFLTTPKEPEFFARDDVYAKGLDWYRGLYAAARPGQLKGEASTLYSLSPHFPETAARMAALRPDLKLIYVLREPVARAYSYYVQLQKNYRRWTGDKRIHRSFEDFLDDRAERAPREKAIGPHDAHLPDLPGLLLDGSDYLRQIHCYLKHFDRSQILFLTFEELSRHPETSLPRIHSFLGLPQPPSGTSLPRENVSVADFERLRYEHALQDTTARLPWLKTLGRILPAALRQKGRNRLARLSAAVSLKDTGTPPPLRVETRAMLHARFAADRGELSRLTGLDLDHWWGPATPASDASARPSERSRQAASCRS